MGAIMTDASASPLMLFNSLTRSLKTFKPVHPGEARIYSCGPTVYNYQHIGNMRAYVFADTLGRTLSYKGYKLTHVINITDVGHLTSDADAGDDKMEKAAAAQGKSAWDIAAFYQADFETDLARLNIRDKRHPRATEYVDAMIQWGKSIADKHCYELDGGLYFDTATVPGYGSLARHGTDEGESRIDPVDGKRALADFAIWRKTPPGETRQMEWDSPWGRGAPGWHLECSVMSEALLGFPFDIHTGGIDHREIHHPNEIAQNQAHSCSPDSGAQIWMHNNFLVERSGKMSKSSGEFLRLQLLIDKGYHPLAYRLMCLQAHYRSELEFSWEGLGAALTRLKRMAIAIGKLQNLAGSAPSDVHDEHSAQNLARFEEAMFDDLNTPRALEHFEAVVFNGPRSIPINLEGQDELIAQTCAARLANIGKMDAVLGLDILGLTREELRVRPKAAAITEDEIEAILVRRKEARAAKDFAASDALRGELAAAGVEVMDGDPIGWDWQPLAN